MVRETVAMRGQDAGESRLQRSVSALAAAEARYLVVGAYAVVHHTEPRYTRELATTYGGVPIRVLGLDDLILTKRALGRAQDLLDVERLEAARDTRR
jgi:hypothetical protein